MKPYSLRTDVGALRNVTWRGIAGIFLLVAVACGPSGHNEAREPIRIGALLPLTGPAAFYGEWCKLGMDLAVGTINAEGGIGGRPLEILYGDTKNEPKEGVTLANKLLLQRPPVILTAMTGVTFAILPVLDDAEVVTFMTVVTHPTATGRSHWAFRYYVNKGAAASRMAGYAYHRLGIRDAAVLYINDEGGLGERTAFVQAFTSLGGRIRADEPYDKSAQELRPSILRLLAKSPAAIYFSGYGRIYGVGLRQMRELGVKAQVLASYEPLYRATRELAGEGLEGVIFSGPILNTGGEAGRSFMAEFKREYGREPELDSGFGFDSVRLIAEALRQGGSEPHAVRQTLIGIRGFHGVFGDVNVLPSGDMDVPLAINRFENGQAIRLTDPDTETNAFRPGAAEGAQ